MKRVMREIVTVIQIERWLVQQVSVAPTGQTEDKRAAGMNLAGLDAQEISPALLADLLARLDAPSTRVVSCRVIAHLRVETKQ